MRLKVAAAKLVPRQWKRSSVSAGAVQENDGMCITVRKSLPVTPTPPEIEKVVVDRQEKIPKNDQIPKSPGVLKYSKLCTLDTPDVEAVMRMGIAPMKERLGFSVEDSALFCFEVGPHGNYNVGHKGLFEMLFRRQVELRSLLAADVSAAQCDLKHLNLHQLLHFRSLENLHKLTDACHATHRDFIETAFGYLYERLGNYFIGARCALLNALKGSNRESALRHIGFNIMKIAAIMELAKQDGWIENFGDEQTLMNWVLLIRITKGPTHGEIADSCEVPSSTDLPETTYESKYDILTLYLEWPTLQLSTLRPQDESLYHPVDCKAINTSLPASRCSSMGWDIIRISAESTHFGDFDPWRKYESCIDELKDSLKKRQGRNSLCGGDVGEFEDNMRRRQRFPPSAPPNCWAVLKSANASQQEDITTLCSRGSIDSNNNDDLTGVASWMRASTTWVRKGMSIDGDWSAPDDHFDRNALLVSNEGIWNNDTIYEPSPTMSTAKCYEFSLSSPAKINLMLTPSTTDSHILPDYNDHLVDGTFISDIQCHTDTEVKLGSCTTLNEGEA